MGPSTTEKFYTENRRSEVITEDLFTQKLHENIFIKMDKERLQREKDTDLGSPDSKIGKKG